MTSRGKPTRLGTINPGPRQQSLWDLMGINFLPGYEPLNVLLSSGPPDQSVKCPAPKYSIAGSPEWLTDEQYAFLLYPSTLLKHQVRGFTVGLPRYAM